MKPLTEPVQHSAHRLLNVLICSVQVAALILTGIVAAQPDTSHGSKPAVSVVQSVEHLAAGVGDTSPTDDSATSDQKKQSNSHGWWTAQLTSLETVRSIRFVSGEFRLDRSEEYQCTAELPRASATLGEVSAQLPFRFALVGQRPSGTS